MGFEKRCLGTGTVAEADQHYTEYQYNDASGSLTVGKPVYVDVTDAGEYNALNATTALSPAVSRSNGKVVLGTNANAGVCVGIYAPLSPSEKPNKGEIIRVCDRGLCLASGISPAAGAAGNVGGFLVESTTQTDGVTSAARVAGSTIGQIVATGTKVAVGNTVIVAASAVSTLLNLFVKLV